MTAHPAHTRVITNCLRCDRLKVGGELRDELYCTAGRPTRMFLEDLGGNPCPHGMKEAGSPHWNRPEDVWLARNYHRGARPCATWLGRSKQAIINRAQCLRLKPRIERRAWTAAEDDYLRAHYDGSRESRRQIGAHLGRTANAVQSRAVTLTATTKRQPRWSRRQLKYVEDRAWRWPLEKIARQTGRTTTALRIIMKRRHIHVRQRWTLNDVMDLFRTANHDLISAAIDSGRLPAVRRLDNLGRATYQIAAADVARFVIDCVNHPPTPQFRGVLHWLSIDPKRLEDLEGQANGCAAEIRALADRLRQVLEVYVAPGVSKPRTYVGQSLRAGGYTVYVPGKRAYLLTDAPAHVFDEIFLPKVRRRIRISAHNPPPSS